MNLGTTQTTSKQVSFFNNFNKEDAPIEKKLTNHFIIKKPVGNSASNLKKCPSSKLLKNEKDKKGKILAFANDDDVSHLNISRKGIQRVITKQSKRSSKVSEISISFFSVRSLQERPSKLRG